MAARVSIDSPRCSLSRAGQVAIAFDLRAVLEDALDAVAARAAERGIEAAFHLAPAAPTRVVGDPDRLRQASARVYARTHARTHARSLPGRYAVSGCGGNAGLLGGCGGRYSPTQGRVPPHSPKPPCLASLPHADAARLALQQRAGM